MKIVNILGGLGNQMFQYAFLIALRHESGIETAYDASVFQTYPLHNGFELANLFNITAHQASKKDIRQLSFYTSHYFLWRILKRLPHRKTQLFEPPHGAYTPSILKDKRDLYYFGIWQDHRYFDSYKDIIKEEFTWKKDLDLINKQAFDGFLARDTVSIHVRRGDYLNEWRYKGICDLDYYRKAIAYIKKHFGQQDLHFAIFSNDIPWSKENIIPLLGENTYTIVDWNQGETSSNDMRLMSACRINIIANSSFSWWAAYLNFHINPIIVAPKKWTNADVCFDRQLDNWILID